MALALTRNPGESLVFHAPGVGLIKVTIKQVDPGKHVRILIEAPEAVRVMREELLFRTPRTNDQEKFFSEVD